MTSWSEIDRYCLISSVVLSVVLNQGRVIVFASQCGNAHALHLWNDSEICPETGNGSLILPVHQHRAQTTARQTIGVSPSVGGYPLS